MTYKHIMVAVDGSESSVLAMQEAIKLSKNQRSSLRIVHVLDDSFIHYGETYHDYASLLEHKRQNGNDILKKMGDLAHRAHIKYEIELLETKVLEGRVAEKLMEAAQLKPTDMLIMGTHGRRGLSHLFLGSVAENVMRIATLPILLVRSK